MATCSSLRSLFENLLPENPTLIESLSSWNHHKPVKPIESSSFAEIFGELYFQEKPESPATILPAPSPLPLLAPVIAQAPQPDGSPKNRHRCDRAKSSESLQLCTEGLGSESADDVDDLMANGDDWRSCGRGELGTGRRQLMYNRDNGHSKCCRDMKKWKEFPPPISSIGKSGKPWVCLKSYREGGRFVLREIRIPSQEVFRASREDGRLRLQFVHPDEEDVIEVEEEEEEAGGEDGTTVIADEN